MDIDNIVNPEDMTEDQINKLVELGIIPARQTALQKQMEHAMALRDAAPPGMHVAGRVAVSQSPLEAIGHLMNQYAAQKEMKGIQDKQTELENKQAAYRRILIDAVRNKGVPNPMMNIQANSGAGTTYYGPPENPSG